MAFIFDHEMHGLIKVYAVLDLQQEVLDEGILNLQEFFPSLNSLKQAAQKNVLIIEDIFHKI
jgi:hypothetical protein